MSLPARSLQRALRTRARRRKSQGWPLEQMRAQLEESCRVKHAISDALLLRVWQWAEASKNALHRGRRIFFFGNGGSAADAQHLAAELVGKFCDRGRPALPALALTTNTSTLTAVANDFDYADVFLRQVEGLVRPGDVVVGISTSGRSPNVLRALHAARERRALTVCLTGVNGETLKGLADIVIAVPSADTQRIQESHITLGHIYCDLLDSYFGRRVDR